MISLILHASVLAFTGLCVAFAAFHLYNWYQNPDWMEDPETRNWVYAGVALVIGLISCSIYLSVTFAKRMWPAAVEEPADTTTPGSWIPKALAFLNLLFRD